MKKIISVILSFAMLASVCIIPSFAAETTTVTQEKIYYFNDFAEGTAYLCDDTTGGVKTVLENELPDYLYTPDSAISNSLSVSSDNLSVLKTSIESATKSCFWKFPTVTLEEKPELIMEYKFRFTSVYRTSNYMKSDYSDAISLNSGSSKGINVDATNGVIYTDSNNDTIVADGMNLCEWNTISIVYSNEKATRDIYINGVYKLTSKEGVYENQYFSTNKLCLMQCVGIDSTLNSFEMDYLKIYSLPENFTAEIKNSTETATDAIEVSFNFIPNAKPDVNNFTLSGGATVDKVEQINENTFKIIPAEALAGGTAYTLSFADIKDSLGRTVDIQSVNFKTMNLAAYEAETVYYYNDFTTGSELPEHITAAATPAPALSISKDNHSVMTINGYHATAASGYKFPTITPEGKPELYVEYRFRMDLGSNGYLGSFVDIFGVDRHGDSKGVTFGGLTNGIDFSKSARLDNSKVEAIAEDLDFSNWNTVTLVYSNTDSSRDVYLNGKYLGTSEAGQYENRYAENGTFTLAHAVYKPSEDHEFELDYVKIYKKSEDFTCKVENANEVSANGMIVHFNSTPLEESVKAENFSLSDGTGVSVEKIDETTFRLVTKEALDYNTSYILTVDGITDIHDRSLNQAKILVKTKNETTYSEEKVYYYNDFAAGSAYINNNPGVTGNDTSADLPNELAKQDGIGISLEAATDSEGNESVLRVKSTASNKIYSWCFPQVTPVGKPDLTVEFRYRTWLSSQKYMRSETDAYLKNNNASRTVDIRGNSLYIDSSATTSLIPTYADLTWNTVKIVYKANEGTRDVYVNGEYKASATNTESSLYENNYYTTGSFALYNTVYITTNNYIDIDYVKIYSAPESLEAKIENSTSVDPEAIELTFNASVKSVSEKQISIDGIIAKSVAKKEGNTYVITPGKPLKGNTAHKLSLNGIVSDSGKALTDTYSFTTKQMADLTVTVSVAEGGNVLVNGLSEAAITIEYATPLTISVETLRGYNLVSVTLDGKKLKADEDGIYVTDSLIRNATVEVTFELDTAEPEVDDAVSEAFIESVTTAYVFGEVTDNNLKYELKEYGVLVAKNSEDLTYGSAIKLQATDSYEGAPGKFGIKIVDSSFTLGGNYFVLPYAVYAVDGAEDYITYGNDIIEINIWNN